MATRYQARTSFATVVDRQRYRFVEGRLYDLADNVRKALAGKDNDYFVKVTVGDDDEVVEQATAAPGEKRTTKRTK